MRIDPPSKYLGNFGAGAIWFVVGVCAGVWVFKDPIAMNIVSSRRHPFRGFVSVFMVLFMNFQCMLKFIFCWLVKIV